MGYVWKTRAMNIYVKLTVLLILFLLFFTAMNFKVNNLKLRRDIIKLEEKVRYLNIKLENKKKRFHNATVPDNMIVLAKKHNIVLKSLENIEIVKPNEAEVPPLAKNDRENP